VARNVSRVTEWNSISRYLWKSIWNVGNRRTRKKFSELGSVTEKMEIELIQIDGKTKRGSYDREKGLKALHSISAWSSERGLMLGMKNK